MSQDLRLDPRAPPRRLLRARLRRLLVVVALLPGGARAHGVLPLRAAGRRGRRHRRHGGQARLPGLGRPAAALAGRLGLVGGGASARRWRCWPSRRRERRRSGARPRPSSRSCPGRASCCSPRCASSTRSTGRSARSPAGGRYALPELQIPPVAARGDTRARPARRAVAPAAGDRGAARRPSGSRSRSRSPSSTCGCSTAPAAACCSPSSSTSPRAPSATPCSASPDADAARMDWLVGVLWFALALVLLVADREAWRAAPRSAVARGTAPVVA